MSWIDVEFEVPEDGEIVEVKVGRHHVMEMRYVADADAWMPHQGKIRSSEKYPYKVEKWRRKDGQSIDKR